MIEAGTYYARGVGVDFGIANGKEQVAIQFRIEGGSEPGSELPYYGFFTDRTAERTVESLRFCGWDTDNLGDVTAEVIGRNLVKIVVEHDSYNGKVRPKIAWVNRVGGTLVKNQMGAGQKADFARKMKAVAMRVDKSLAASSGVKAPPSVERSSGGMRPGDCSNDAPQGDFGDDDIPF